MKDLNLSQVEKDAKDFVLNLMLNGMQISEPCDVSYSDDQFKLPEFYDEMKFKRGQKYFADNRNGIMFSNLYGLFSLIAEPTGAILLDRTEQSSVPKTARKRYISTVVHMLSWYTEELKPGSKSWESLKRVRKMHLSASKFSLNATKGQYLIDQGAMTMTLFGFMGYAVVKPHQLGIPSNQNKNDREAFIHFWAVIGSMLGIKDEFNMCLFPLDVVEVICHVFIRYAFNPFLQLETPTFKKLAKAFIEGIGWFIPLSSYESRLFLARRLAGVPGYQYDIDLSKEYFQKQIFSQDELQILRKKVQNKINFEYRKNLVFDEKMHIIDIKRFDDQFYQNSESYDCNSNVIKSIKNWDESNDDNTHYMVKLLDLQHPSQLTITEINDNNLQSHLNDDKFKLLSWKDQLIVKISIYLHNVNMTSNRFLNIFNIFNGILYDTIVVMMKKEAA